MKSTIKLAMAMLAAGFVALGIPKAYAAETDTIAVTVTLAEIISVSVDVETWALGAKALSETAVSQLIIALNDGNVDENFAIKAADVTDGWALGATADADQFALGFDTSDPYETFTAMDTTGVSLAVNIAVAGTQTFKMQYSMPTGNTKVVGAAQGFAITVTASKYTP